MAQYYELQKAKKRCNIDEGDVTFDDLLNDFGATSDQEIDDEMYNMASINRLITALPVLPLSSPPQSIKDASTDRIVYRFWLKQQNLTAANEALKASERNVANYIARLKVDKQKYGIIV